VFYRDFLKNKVEEKAIAYTGNFYFDRPPLPINCEAAQTGGGFSSSTPPPKI
jgi:hypothetical protein